MDAVTKTDQAFGSNDLVFLLELWMGCSSHAFIEGGVVRIDVFGGSAYGGVDCNCVLLLYVYVGRLSLMKEHLCLSSKAFPNNLMLVVILYII